MLCSEGLCSEGEVCESYGGGGSGKETWDSSGDAVRASESWEEEDGPRKLAAARERVRKYLKTQYVITER